MYSTLNISIIVVTYKSQDLIDRCLTPIITANVPGVEIVVWDNASPDGTVEYIRAKYPTIKLITSANNLGFAKGNNAALAHCAGEVIVLLNPDAFIKDMSDIIAMANYVHKNPSIAAVGPQLLNADGSHQVGDAGWRFTLRNVIGHFLFIHRLNSGFPAIYLSNDVLLLRKEVDVDWICGACLITRRNVVDIVGGLDSDIFMYSEDVEWGERCRDRGYRLVYLPTYKVLHIQGGTQRSESDPFFSTSAMDALAHRISTRISSLEFILFQIVLVVGYVIRGGIYWLTGTIKRKPHLISKSSVMLCYARHARRLTYQLKTK
jgi:N-acetylglucosaminyl-diphospho-decaprenol L-rhamnosyltransferase